MRFLRRTDANISDDDQNQSDTDNAVGSSDESAASRAERAHTPRKGRATPKRREAEAKRRGPVAPPPRTMREAMKRNKEIRKQNPVSKDERRATAKEQRARMLAGDEKYLLPRDRGPIKAYVRDLVDSRRNLLGLFMPLAVVVFVALLVPQPQIQQYATLACTVMLLAMIAEGVLNGRRIAKEVRAKFPKEYVRGGAIGWYAFVRASQLRRLRIPKPRVRPGEAVS